MRYSQQQLHIGETVNKILGTYVTHLVPLRQNTWALVLTYHQIEMNSGIIT